MTDTRSYLQGIVRTLAVAACVTACTTDDATDYCKNHYVFHAEHLADVGTLALEMHEDGHINSSLQLPRSALAGMADASVGLAPESVFRVSTASQCEHQRVSETISNSGFAATFASDCGADNDLGQIDVLLFEALPALDEMLVDIKTPVTAKRFAISRQCANPIFRIERGTVDDG